MSEPKHKVINVALSFNVDVSAITGIEYVTNPDLLGEAANNLHYDEGRYCLDVELLTVALSRHLQAAVGELVLKHMQQKHGVNTSRAIKNVSLNVAYEEAGKYMKNDLQYVSVNADTLRFAIYRDDA